MTTIPVNCDLIREVTTAYDAHEWVDVPGETGSRLKTTRPNVTMPISDKAEKIGHWGYEYASSIDIYREADGTIILECQGMKSNGYQADWHRIKFANYVSFAAWKTEVAYCDREHRLPGQNPHARPWKHTWIGR